MHRESLTAVTSRGTASDLSQRSEVLDTSQLTLSFSA